MSRINYLSIFIVLINMSACAQKTTTDENAPIISHTDITFEIFAENLEVPWSIVFTSTERMMLNERPGRVRVIENGVLNPEPILRITNISSRSEEGLMGLALDPDYQSKKFVYLSYAYESGSDLFVKIIRMKDENNKLTGETVILDRILADNNHAGCRLRFGPDKKLYITTGDATNRKDAQDLTKLHGKILRINSDGSIPNDNPFPNSAIWSYGHRNPQGIDWYPGTDVLWETEHGPSGFDGPGGGDEVNVIVKGKNYGWPEVSHEENKEGMVSPLLVFTPAEAPASGIFYKSDKLRNFKNNFFFGCLRGNGIIRVVVDDNDKSKVKSHEKFAANYGRIREVAEGPDGFIYFSTSNKDGRGSPRSGDDKIYRIVPK